MFSKLKIYVQFHRIKEIQEMNLATKSYIQITKQIKHLKTVKK